MFTRISSYLVIFAIVLLAACAPNINDARKAETEERFSDAYQIYSEILVAASRSFTLPEQKLWKSGNDVEDWIAESTAAYTQYALNKPKAADLKESFEKLEGIEPQLTYLENAIRLEDSIKLTPYIFAIFLQASRLPDQKLVPKIIREAATSAYNSRLSIVVIKGDGVSYVEGGLYNEESNVSAKYSLTSSQAQTHDGAMLLLRPGKWVAVSRIIPSRSNENDKQYLDLNGIRGRYAGTFFSVPDESHLMVMKFCARASHSC
jgi:hypothetical protein